MEVHRQQNRQSILQIGTRKLRFFIGSWSGHTNISVFIPPQVVGGGGFMTQNKISYLIFFPLQVSQKRRSKPAFKTNSQQQWQKTNACCERWRKNGRRSLLMQRKRIGRKMIWGGKRRRCANTLRIFITCPQTPCCVAWLSICWERASTL